MKRRSKMSRKGSKRNFKSGARVQNRNYKTGSMRGGIRL
jgi:hypothetical protein